MNGEQQNLVFSTSTGFWIASLYFCKKKKSHRSSEKNLKIGVTK